MHGVLGSNLDVMHNFHFSFFCGHTDRFVSVHTRQTWYILVCTRFVSVHTFQAFVTVCTRFVPVHTVQGLYLYFKDMA
jgi:hypothetical protein